MHPGISVSGFPLPSISFIFIYFNFLVRFVVFPPSVEAFIKVRGRVWMLISSENYICLLQVSNGVEDYVFATGHPLPLFLVFLSSYLFVDMWACFSFSCRCRYAPVIVRLGSVHTQQRQPPSGAGEPIFFDRHIHTHSDQLTGHGTY